jgi:hypothetical protein
MRSTKSRSTPLIPWTTLNKLAIAAEVDPRTLKRVLSGHDVRGYSGERARRILSAHGFLPAADLAAR